VRAGLQLQIIDDSRGLNDERDRHGTDGQANREPEGPESSFDPVERTGESVELAAQEFTEEKSLRRAALSRLSARAHE
jgi:hypothetical protein